MSSKSPIYLDHAAATPVDPAVLKAMLPYFSEEFYNPSAAYGPARDVHHDLEMARSKVAHWLGTRSSEIIFTAGATEANNLVLLGLAAKHENGHIVSSPIEHESILEPLAHLKRHGWQHTLVKPTDQGLVTPEAVASAITDSTILVSIGYANNEIGTVQPIREIARKIDDIRKDRRQKGGIPLYFHTDACQAANYLDLHVSRLGVDLMTLNGGKIYGPKQSGALYVKGGITPEPIIFGGGQERGLRSGTENMAAAVGFSVALELAQQVRRDETARLRKLQKQFIEQLRQAVPLAVINGSLQYRLPNNIHVAIPGQDNERLLIQLDEAGILAAAGSACSADSEEPSHVLRAIGVSDRDARASLRFTMGRATSEADIRYALEVLTKLVV